MRTLASRLLATILVPVIATGVTVAIGFPAQAYETDYLYANKWAYTDIAAPKAVFIGETVDTPVGAWRDAQDKFHSSRQYFSFDLARLTGKKVTQARLFVGERSVNDCTISTPVEVWRTGPITTSMSWLKPPKQLQKITTLSMGAPATCPGFFEIDLLPAVQTALARGESQVTFGLRLPLEKEFLEKHGRKMAWRPVIQLTANTVPVVGEVGLEFENPACGTPENPTVIRGWRTFRAVIDDPDRFDFAYGQFAMWPVDAPEQRVEFYGSRYYPNIVKADRSVEEYDHGTRLAWAVRGYDEHDYSPWSEPCYATIDKEPPAKAPVVTSTDYPEGWTGAGGPGMPGTFTFDAQGDPDVVAYEWDDNSGYSRRVDAPSPGAPATMTYTPTRSGPIFLSVRSVDRAHSRGPEYEYNFYVRDTAPYIELEVGGVGLPSRVSMMTVIPEVTAFSVQVGDGPEVRFPAVDGNGSTEVTFTESGLFQVTGRSYAGDQLLGLSHESFFVNDRPAVESEDFVFPDHDGVVGRPGTFTFRPRSLNVVAYQYTFDGEQWGTVQAGPDGVATLTWTPVESGWHTIYVRSQTAGGALSEVADYQFNVVDPRPYVYSGDLVNWPRTDGVGMPMTFDISTLMPEVTEYIYSIDDGPETTVAADPAFTRISWTPPTAGDHVFHARSRFADGTLSPVRDWEFHIWTGPVVTSAEYPYGHESGQPGTPGTFSLTPALPNVVEYRVTLPDNTEQVIPADANGEASFTYTPRWSGWTMITIVSRSADGTESDARMHTFTVRDPSIRVNSFYVSYFPRGGVGISGYVELNTGVYTSVTEWLYWVNDGPVQTVPGMGYNTRFDLVPERSGENVLHVRYRTGDGQLSPVTDYPFLVGTAPVVSSTDYPTEGFAGGPGIPGEFRFSGGTAGIVEFVYRVEAVFGPGAAETVVPVVDGVAVATFTPQTYYVHYMYVRGRLADGTLTDETVYFFVVAQPPAPTPTWGAF